MTDSGQDCSCAGAESDRLSISALERFVLIAACLFMLAACGGFPQQPELRADQNSLRGRVERSARPATEENRLDEESEGASSLRRPFEERLTTRAVPGLTEPSQEVEGEKTAPDPGPQFVDASVPPLALPTFIDVVFGQILRVPYSTGPGISARSDVIQLRSSGSIPARDFLSLISTTLKDYGVRVSPQDGLYQVVEESSARERMPRFLRGRSRPSTPAALRPVVQFVQLRAMDALSMRNLLQQAFPRGGALDVQNDPATGSIILKGLPEDIDAALDIIETMDDLTFSNSQVLQFKPVYWQVDKLSEQLAAILRAEGWQVSEGDRQILPIHIMPVPFSNNLLAFVKEAQARERVVHWLEYLDQPAEMGDTDQIFIFDAQNSDASIIAETVNSVLSTMQTGSAARAEQTAAGGTPSEQQGQITLSEAGGRIVVDPQGNRLIFSGSASEYQRILPLFRRLDQPTPEVLIEVTVAEVTLTDETRYGIEFFAEAAGNTGTLVDFGTQGGLGLGGSGLSLGAITGDFRSAFNAFAQNQQVNVLSTPRLVARSGGAASIQVGTDVPVITSQAAAAQQSGEGARDVLQTVSFRSTGVLLNIEPIVFSTGRVDLTITQEVSAALPNPNQAIASPIINNRSLTTQLTLEDGGTAVLGGLIQDNVTRGKTGIPLLKDIPWLGNLFSVDSLSVERTELLIFITPYIIQSSEDRARFVDFLTNELNSSLGNPLLMRTRLPTKP